MKCPEGCTSVSFEGKEYAAEAGIVALPEDAQLTMYGFGLVNAPEELPGEPEELPGEPEEERVTKKGE